MKSLDSAAENTIVKNEAGKRNEADRHWQMAGDRALLYLRCLNFPAPRALELALGALKAAEQSMGPDSGNGPVGEAMHALEQLLAEQNPANFEPGRSPAVWCECVIPAAPPLYRLPMVPDEIASAHWRSLLKSLLNRIRRSRFRKGAEDGARIST